MDLYRFSFFEGRSSASPTTYQQKSKCVLNYDPKEHFETLSGKIHKPSEAGGFSKILCPKFRKKFTTFFWCDKIFSDQNVFFQAQWDEQVDEIPAISISDPKILNETRQCALNRLTSRHRDVPVFGFMHTSILHDFEIVRRV